MADEQQGTEDPVEAAENLAASNGNAAFNERLRQQAAQIRSARAEAAKLRSELEGVVKTHLPLAEVDKLKAQMEAERAAWGAEKAVYAIGITDPQAIKVAQLFYSDLPAENRPPLADWLRGLRDKPGEAPKALQPYFTAPPAQSSADPGTRQKPPPASSTTTTTTGAASGELSADQIRTIQQRAFTSGDWTEWDRYFPRK